MAVHFSPFKTGHARAATGSTVRVGQRPEEHRITCSLRTGLAPFRAVGPFRRRTRGGRCDESNASKSSGRGASKNVVRRPLGIRQVHQRWPSSAPLLGSRSWCVEVVEVRVVFLAHIVAQIHALAVRLGQAGGRPAAPASRRHPVFRQAFPLVVCAAHRPVRAHPVLGTSCFFAAPSSARTPPRSGSCGTNTP